MIHTTKRVFVSLLALLLAALMAVTGSGCQKTDGTPDTPDTPSTPDPQVDPIDDNFRTFYQIFVGSYSDSNGDGIGDLRGIINRFDYLNDGNIHSGESLGVQGIWLSPIFSSPSYHKYDASDYYKIDWRFGTEDDLRELAALCEARNVKLILDLALNHTSTSHSWFTAFKEARMAGNTSDPYYDYYACVATADKVGGVSYQKIAGVDCWYECNFSGDMPELNFDNPAVREATLDVAKYYLDLGVDGFRFDAVKYIYYGDTARSTDFWEWYMEELRKVDPDVYCVGECWSGESEIMEYYSAMNCFNFATSQAEGVVASAAKGTSISKYTGYIASYQRKVLEKNPDGMPISFLSNHDMDRIAGVFVLDRHMRMAANLYLLSPGSPVIYYGEELGMRGSRGSANTDANRRLAMLWGDGTVVRDPVGATYPADKQIQSTAADQIADENSLYNYYRRLIAIRHEYPAIARGTYTSLSCGQNTFGGFTVTYGEEVLVLLHNTSAETVTYDLSSCTGLAGKIPTTLAAFIGSGNATLEGSVLTVGAGTSVILK